MVIIKLGEKIEDLRKKNKWIILIAIIVIAVSLIGNLLLWTQLRDYQDKNEFLMEKNYTAFFNDLEVYNNRLDYIVNYEGSPSEIEREVISLQKDVESLINHAESYGLGNTGEEDVLASVIWEIAMSAQWMLLEQFLQADELELVENLDKINENEIREFSTVISEIIILENRAMEEYNNSSKRFSHQEMADLLRPKAVEASKLTFLK